MRELSFRIWDEDEKKMIYNEHMGAYVSIDNMSITPVRCKIMQWSGTTDDERGADIYEGDIVEFSILVSGRKLTKKAKIIFKNGMFTTNDQDINSWVSKKTKVIGNIYENRDLI